MKRTAPPSFMRFSKLPKARTSPKWAGIGLERRTAKCSRNEGNEDGARTTSSEQCLLVQVDHLSGPLAVLLTLLSGSACQFTFFVGQLL